MSTQSSMEQPFYNESAFRCHCRGGPEINEFIGMSKDSHFEQRSDDFEGLQTEELGKVGDFDVIADEDSLARVARFEQVSRSEFGRPRRWLGWSARKGREWFRGFFRVRSEFITAHKGTEGFNR